MPRFPRRFVLIPLAILAAAAPAVLAQPAATAPALVFSTGLTAVEKPPAGSLTLSTGGALAEAGRALSSDAGAVGKALADLGYQAVNVTADDLATSPAAARDLAGKTPVPL